MATVKMTLSECQGSTNLGGESRDFGYVFCNDGGWFFTWMDTIDETIASVEQDTEDGPGGVSAEETRAFLRKTIPTTSIYRAKKARGIDF